MSSHGLSKEKQKKNNLCYFVFRVLRGGGRLYEHKHLPKTLGYTSLRNLMITLKKKNYSGIGVTSS